MCLEGQCSVFILEIIIFLKSRVFLKIFKENGLTWDSRKLKIADFPDFSAGLGSYIFKYNFKKNLRFLAFGATPSLIVK